MESGQHPRRLSGWLADARRRIIDVDDGLALLMRCQRKDVIGCDLLDLIHPDDRHGVRETLELIARDQIPLACTYRITDREGAALWVESHIGSTLAVGLRHYHATVDPEEQAIGEDTSAKLRAAAERILTKRRLRAQYFGEDMFGEPAFDLLLELFVRAHEGRDVHTTSAAVASGAPLTTALRQITALVDRGYIQRGADPVDRRRVLLQLTPTGMATMHGYLDAAERV
jgi:hypothetical protein